jgi:hypothetical protein
MNPKLGAANVGPNPGSSTRHFARRKRRWSHRQRGGRSPSPIGAVQATPTPDCSSPAQQSDVQSLIQSTGVTANAIETLYGSDNTHPGQLFVPAERDRDGDRDASPR